MVVALFGIEAGSKYLFFESSPSYVDKRKPPGYSPVDDYEKSLSTLVKQTLTLEYFIFSPNLLWFCITVMVYCFFPYDLEAAKTFQAGWILARVAFNTVLTGCYTFFWSYTLYRLQLCKRKYTEKLPTPFELFHNVFYTFAGVVQYSLLEVLFMNLWASGKLAADFDIENKAVFIIQVLAVPLVRELHFFCAHKLLHLNWLYRFVHALHHRNTTTIEPFSGIAMHFVEHVYYFGNACLVLYTQAHPFVFLWIGLHALLSPMASHSGWQDAYQSDQFHTVHHAKGFCCNFGSSFIPFDYWFGTYRLSLGTTDKVEKEDKKYVPKEKAFTQGDFVVDLMPKPVELVYNCCNLAILFGFLYVAMDENSGLSVVKRECLAWAVGFGPILSGWVLLQFNDMARKKPLTYPFHKEPVQLFSLHLLMSLVFVVLPVYQTARLVLL